MCTPAIVLLRKIVLKTNGRLKIAGKDGASTQDLFQTLSNNDKLAMLFVKLIDIEEKLPSFQKLQNTVDEIKGKAAIKKNL